MTVHPASAPIVLPGSALPPALPHSVGAAIPAASAAEVERPRLDGTLNRLRAGEVRCVCLWAPAGSGKSTLLAAWARRLHQAGEATTWLTVPEPGRLRAGELWRQAGWGEPGPLPSGDAEERYLFIDDFDRWATQRSGLLVELIASMPAGIRLVLAGRLQPGGGLTSLRATGAIVDVPPAHLAFDRSELYALAARHRVVLSQEEEVLLLQRTEGWATGLGLLLSSLEVGADSTRMLRAFDGDDPRVAGFLRAEIIAGWEDGDEATLLRAAVRDVISVDLAGQVTHRADAGKVLERLAGRNALITKAGSERDEYRIHPILLAYLQAEARRRGTGAAAAAHETAARWFAERNDGHHALEQALAAGTPGIIGEMLDGFGLDLVLRGTPDGVLRALAGPATPAGHRREPVAATLRLLLDAPYFPDRGLARHLLADLGASGRPSGDRAESWSLVIDALTAFYAGTDEEIRGCLAGLAAARIPGRARRNLGAELLAATAEAWCRGGLGDAEQAEEGLREVAVSSRNAGYAWLFLLASDLAAASAARRGDWKRAGSLDDQVARATDAETRPGTGAGASVPGEPFDRAAARAWVSRQVRRYERCDPLDTDGLEQIVSADPLVADAGLVVPAQALLTLAELAADPKPRSELERLNGLLRETGSAHPRVLSLCCLPWFDLTGALDGRTEAGRVTRQVEAVLGADSLEAVLLRSLANPPARGRNGVGGRLEAAATPAGRCWRGSTLVSAWLVLAGIAQENERPAEADARLVRALRLAEQLRIERAFLGLGGLGVSLLEARIGRLADLDDFARRILSLSGASLSDPHLTSAADLTQRERELLRELPFHQSVADIARKHNVSANTVKTHLRNIYQKLEAADRAAAVVIAHERGIL